MRKEYSISELCEALKISRSGYYVWRRGRRSVRSEQNRELKAQIRTIHEHRHTKGYGSPRMTEELTARGFSCSRNRVARLMREEAIHARPRRPFRPRTTQPDKAACASPNLLDKSEPASAPGQQIVSDITYLRTSEGWLYLVIVLDLYSRAILGWDLSVSLDADGVSRAVRRALKSGYVHPEAIFHSDRGCQYTSRAVRKVLAGPALRQSMSARGYCYDNAFAESCFATIKAEALPESGVFSSHQSARRAIFDYLETFYNRSRLHSAISYLSPLRFLELYFHKQQQYLK